MAKRSQKSRRKSVHYCRGDALLIVDGINDLNFPGAEKVLPWGLKLAARLSAFRIKAGRFGLPVIYVNDNFGLWHSSFAEVYAHCTRREAQGRQISRRLNHDAAIISFSSLGIPDSSRRPWFRCWNT
jgi:nicotinamidase-related amidase